MRRILGIDVGGTNIKWAVFDESLSLLSDKNSIKTDAFKGPNSIIDKICNIILENPNCEIGIGFPAVVSKSGFVAISPNMPGFISIDLKKEIESKSDAKVHIDNDANVAALAENQIGAGKDLESFLYVTLGTGVGGALILNKKLFKGENSGAGEIGYTVLNFDEIRDAPLQNRKGILEDYAGSPRLLEFYRSLGGKSEIGLKEISELTNRGNEIAIKTFKWYGNVLAYGFASALNFLDLNTIVVGGGLSRATELMYTSLNKKLKERLLEHKKDNVQILKSRFLNDAGIYGAAALVLTKK